MKHPLCRIEDIPVTGSKIVPFFGREVQLYQVDGEPRAVANVCLHFGGPLECKDGKFVCPWHGAQFALKDGRRLQGPAPEGSRLMVLPTRVEEGVVNYVWGE